MSTKKSFKTYLCLALDTLPCILSSLIIFRWIFFTSAPSTVSATWLWILPMAIATIFSIIYVIYHGTSGNENARFQWYRITTLERATLDLIRSITSCPSLALVSLSIGWKIMTGVSSGLRPMDKDPMESLFWIMVGLFDILLVIVFSTPCVPLISLLVNDLDNFHKAREISEDLRKYEDQLWENARNEETYDERTIIS